MVPSRHLWLGNITQKPTDEQVLEVFATFGKVDSGACGILPQCTARLVLGCGFWGSLRASRSLPPDTCWPLTCLPLTITEAIHACGTSQALGTPKH